MNVLGRKHKSRGAIAERTKPSRSVDMSRVYPVLMLLLVVLIATATYQGVVTLLAKPVSRVVINGDFRQVLKQSLIEEVTPYLEAGFILLDLQSMREKLLAKPWVYEVSVSRNWPDEIAITVVEQTAIARWGEHGFLNHRGSLFEPAAEVDGLLIETLPLLTGPDQSMPKVMKHYRELADMLNQQSLKVYQLALGQRGDWVAVIASDSQRNKVPVYLGASDVMLKMRRFLSLYPLTLANKFEQLGSIDMRYSNGLAVGGIKALAVNS